jgi:S-adenosylmethionine:tRNA ribosyltransferase-isomerase
MYANKDNIDTPIEVFLLRELNKELQLWDALIDSTYEIHIGDKLYFGNNSQLIAEVTDTKTSDRKTIRFLLDRADEEFRKKIEALGEPPLPRYIKRKATCQDKERYQNIFAKNEGSVAVPTAGLHFSDELIKKLRLKGIKFAEITLHVGLGTYSAVDVEDLTKHEMVLEQFTIEQNQADIVNKAIEKRQRVCAVGTTSMRTIESAVSAKNTLKATSDWTNKFIFPPYDFNIANSMITNFHMPGSTLLMMITAFGGYEHVMHAYEVAIKEKYRFHSYGDAMLII